MKTRHFVLACSLVAAALLTVFADKTPDSTVVEPVSRRVATKSVALPSVKSGKVPAGENIARLLPRDKPNEADIKIARSLENSPFESKSWAPLQPPQQVRVVADVPPPPPMAPPLPFIFLGKAVSADGLEVFLARGESTFVVTKSSVIEGTYRVDSIAPPLLWLTYLPLNQVQQLNIGVFD